MKCKKDEKKYCKEGSLIPWLWINKPFIYEFPLFYDRMKMNLVLHILFFLSSELLNFFFQENIK